MCYRGGRGVVPTDESTSTRNCGNAISIIRGHYSRWPPMNSRMMDVGGIAEISSGDRATM